jgi:hypothetical protein
MLSPGETRREKKAWSPPSSARPRSVRSAAVMISPARERRPSTQISPVSNAAISAPSNKPSTPNSRNRGRRRIHRRERRRAGREATEVRRKIRAYRCKTTKPLLSAPSNSRVRGNTEPSESLFSSLVLKAIRLNRLRVSKSGRSYCVS